MAIQDTIVSSVNFPGQVLVICLEQGQNVNFMSKFRWKRARVV